MPCAGQHEVRPLKCLLRAAWLRSAGLSCLGRKSMKVSARMTGIPEELALSNSAETSLLSSRSPMLRESSTRQ